MTVVIGYTQRPEGSAALQRATEEARLREAPLHIVQIVGDSPGQTASQATMLAERLDRLREHGASLVAELRRRGIEGHYQLVTGVASDPAQSLLDVAEGLGADLIVIGLRRRTPLGKLVLGSVAQSVLLGARCPVLAVKSSDEHT